MTEVKTIEELATEKLHVFEREAGPLCRFEGELQWVMCPKYTALYNAELVEKYRMHPTGNELLIGLKVITDYESDHECFFELRMKTNLRHCELCGLVSEWPMKVNRRVCPACGSWKQ